MGEIDDHPLGFHSRHNGAPERGQPALFEPVHRPGEIIVEEMGEPRHAEARGVKLVEIGDVAFEPVQSFDAEHSADGHCLALPRRDQRVELGPVGDREELAVRRCDRAVQLFGVPQRAFEQRVPRPHRLQLRDHQPGDIVGIAAIGVVILALGRLGRAREDLQRDVSVFEPGQIHMAALCTIEKVAAPEQAVAVQIDDGEGLVERLGALADLGKRFAVDLVHAALEDAGGKGEEGARRDEQDNQNANQPAAHHFFLTSVTKLYAGRPASPAG